MSKRPVAKKRSKVLMDTEVLQYLKSNPDFFIRNASFAENLRIPHPARDAVSLVEWQLGRYRQTIEQLEAEIRMLMENARMNEELFTRLITLQKILFLVDNFDDLLKVLNDWARSLGLLGATLRLFSEKWYLDPPSNFCHLAIPQRQFEHFRIQYMKDDIHYLGSVQHSELLAFFTNHQLRQVGSVTLSLLGENADLGILVFSSRDQSHYNADMGTFLLEQISQLLPVLLTRWINLR